MLASRTMIGLVRSGRDITNIVRGIQRNVDVNFIHF